VIADCAASLVQTVRPGDAVARFGGDEFVVLAEAIAGDAGALALAERLRSALAAALQAASGGIATSASLGVAVGHQAHELAEAIVRDADAAMYAAKSSGRDRAVLFDSALRMRVRADDALETDLRIALDREELHVEFQPVVELATGRLVGAEALARWRHPERGLVSPCEFVAVAERSSQIERLDAQILRMTCREAREWRRRRSEHPIWWAINLSPRELRAGFPRELLDVLRQEALPAGAMRVEITETALLEHHDAACAALAELRANGVHVMLDDFGTGMSSLSHLNRPARRHAQARPVVRAGLRTAKDRFIVSGIIHMARMTGLEVVAEGAEHDWEIRLLRALRCPLAQGYRYAAPLEGRELRALPEVLGPPPSPLRRRADAA
jgi:predicted signal transduction protein with EAL and GGDEF domain